MSKLVGATLVLVMLVIGVMITGTAMARTDNVSDSVSPNDTMLASLADEADTALTVFTSFIPILTLLLIGGLVMFYLMGYARVA